MNFKNDKPQKNNSDFNTQVADVKSPIHKIVRFLVRETNKHKLNYDQLRNIFRRTREECDVNVPKVKNELIELPTDDELERFYSCIRNTSHRLMFEVLEGTGLRIDKFVNLKICSIDFSSNQLFIKNAKGGNDRIVVIGNKLKEKILLYLEGKKNIYLFESSRNTKFSTRRIQQICDHYKNMAGISKDLTPHTFRHIWNTRLAAANVSEDKRKILAGHSKNSNVQKIYTHLSLAGIKDEVIPILDDFSR